MRKPIPLTDTQIKVIQPGAKARKLLADGVAPVSNARRKKQPARYARQTRLK